MYGLVYDSIEPIQKGYIMKKFWLLIALWNTVVMCVNLTVLPHLGPDVMTYITPKSQLLPIMIPLALYALSFERVRRLVWR